jgi:hypothetical protein
MKKEKECQAVPVWKQKGFFSKQHYSGFLWFNGLSSEESTYDDVYQNSFTGETINIVEDY